MRREHSFTCDGGKVPSHHQPWRVVIYEENNIFKVGLNGTPLKSMKEAVGSLCLDYDRVTHDWSQTITTTEVNKTIQWNQTVRK